MQYVKGVFKGVTIDLAIHSYSVLILCLLYIIFAWIFAYLFSSPGQRPYELLPSLVVRLRPLYVVNFHIYIISSENPEPNLIKPGRDGPRVGPIQSCVRQLRPLFKMAAVTRIRNIFNCPLLH